MKKRLLRTLLGLMVLFAGFGAYAGTASASGSGCDGSYASGTLNCYGQAAQGITGYGYFTQDTEDVRDYANFVLQQGLTPVTGGSCEYVTNTCTGDSVPSQTAFEDYIYCMYYGNGSSSYTLTNPTKKCSDRFSSSVFFENTPGQNKYGASFIVNTMLGNASPGTYGVTSAMWTDWQSRVDAASFTLAPRLPWGDGINSALFLNMYDSGAKTYGHHDDAFYHVGSGGSGDSIVISSGGKQYILQIACANPVGDSQGLPKANNWTTSGSSAAYSDSSHTTLVSSVNSGTHVYFKHSVTVTGTGTPSGSATMYDMWSQTDLTGTQGSGGSSLGPMSFPTATGTTTNGYYDTIVRTPNSSITGNVGYYCEYVRYTAGSSGGVGTGNAACVKVTNHKPTGSIAVDCNVANGSATVTYTWGDIDGANGETSAFTRIYTGTPGSSSYSGTDLGNWGWTYRAPDATPATQTMNASQTDGTLNIWLYVKDSGPGTDTYYRVAYKTQVECNHLNVTLSCNTNGTGKVAITASDPTATPISVYVANTSGTALTGTHNTPWTWAQTNTINTTWSSWTVAIYSNNPSNGDATYAKRLTLSHGPCASVSCITLSGFGNLAIGSPIPFTLSTTISGSSTQPPTNNTFVGQITGPGGYVYPFNLAGSPTTGNAAVPWPTSASGTATAPTAPGTYTLTASYYGKSLCGSGTAKAGYQPFFNVVSGDVAAGPDFRAANGSCTPNATAGISGVNKEASGNYFGAGTQLAALALGKISDFATGQGFSMAANAPNRASSLTGTPLVDPTLLALANTGAGIVNLAAGQYGGSLNQSSWCVDDYATAASADPNARTNFTWNNLPTIPGTYTYVLTNNQSFGNPNQPMVLSPGVRIKVVVKGGSVYLYGNIMYSGYTSASGIPQFQLLVQGGNISIAPNVTVLHGFYDAQPSGSSGGQILTCGTASYVAIADYDQCRSTGSPSNLPAPLTIYGALTAKSIVLGRTYGNLTAVGSVPAQAAEKVVFSPELWLGGLSVPSAGNWQSASGLPPIL